MNKEKVTAGHLSQKNLDLRCLLFVCVRFTLPSTQILFYFFNCCVFSMFDEIGFSPPPEIEIEQIKSRISNFPFDAQVPARFSRKIICDQSTTSGLIDIDQSSARLRLLLD